MPEMKPILVAGATGYVGGRLVPRLLAAGYQVRAMGRSLEKLACRPWARLDGVQLVQGDVQDLPALERAARGCHSAFYLVHGMVAQKSRYLEVDRFSAMNMRTAAERADLARIIYLGGLGDSHDPGLSRHLSSRHEVGEILRGGAVPVTILRAAMILGSGSASFEILRYLVERLPVMITPLWVRTPTQPIAIENVLDYLMGCLDNAQTMDQIFDIGGPDVLDYAALIRIYAQEAGLPPRRIISVPVLTPRLSALWIHLVTPLPAEIARPLTEGLSVPTVCKDHRIRDLIPLNLIDCRTAMRKALEGILQNQVETSWSDAGVPRPPEWVACGDADYAGGTILTCAYRLPLSVAPPQLWAPIIALGGKGGYLFGDGLWRLRGLLDRWVGGVGLGRGRRHPSELRVGDALDFWRVWKVTPNRRLTLLAEMKVPGDAILDIQIQPLRNGGSELRLISRFVPKGLGGLLYWYALYPFHIWIFKGMLVALAKQVGVTPESAPQAFDPLKEPSCALPPLTDPDGIPIFPPTRDRPK